MGDGLHGPQGISPSLLATLLNSLKDLVVVSTGELKQKYVAPGDKLRYNFIESVPTRAAHILLAVGPFEIHPDIHPNINFTHFCLPGKKQLVEDTTKFFHQVLRPPLLGHQKVDSRDFLAKTRLRNSVLGGRPVISIPC